MSQTSDSFMSIEQTGISSKSLSLKIRDLTVAYHRKPVIWDIDLSIPEGKLVSIVGPNGAGKSTLIKACLDWGGCRAIVSSRHPNRGFGLY